MDISRHPILQSIYEAALAVEACGADPKLTAASMKVHDLLRQANELLDTIPADAGYPCVIEEADFSAGTVTLKMTSAYAVMAGQHLLVPPNPLARAAPQDTIALPVHDRMKADA